MKNYFLSVLSFSILISCDYSKDQVQDSSQNIQEADPDLIRLTYESESTGKERDYFVYLPKGYDKTKKWPVIMFLHGYGEKGNGKDELDYVLIHGPLYEAWIQKRDLPFIIISPQLPYFGTEERFTDRTPDRIPERLEQGTPESEIDRPEQSMSREKKSPPLPPHFASTEGQEDGWNRIENELLLMVDEVIENYAGDPDRIYLTGLSYGGFGSWYMAGHYPEKWAAVAPICGSGSPDLATPVANANLPVWFFQGGRDTVVWPDWMYPVVNALENAGHPEVRFTIHEDLGHDVWVRVYAGNDLYEWFLKN